MIQAQELRIGNLVECFSIREVCVIKEHKIKVRHEISKGHFILEWCPIKSLELNPIPLTEEWLSKFGFKKIGSFYRIKDSRFVEVLIHDDGIDVCNHSIYLLHIKYVHQLQNLYFALTGEKL